jgi:uncharacterized protein (TIGR00369 family)
VAHPEHCRRLERLYAAAPVTQWYGARLRIDHGYAEVRLTARPEFHHAARAVHGSVYFRALDDAAFFAANSRVLDVLVLTVSSTIHFLRPVATGELTAIGRVVQAGARLTFDEAHLFDVMANSWVKVAESSPAVRFRSMRPLDMPDRGSSAQGWRGARLPVVAHRRP